MVWIVFRSSNLTRQLLADPRATIRPWRSPYLGWRASPNALIRTRIPGASDCPDSNSALIFEVMLLRSLTCIATSQILSPTTVSDNRPADLVLLDHSGHDRSHAIVDRLNHPCRTLVPRPADRKQEGERGTGCARVILGLRMPS
jgi:hypothetical protein